MAAGSTSASERRPYSGTTGRSTPAVCLVGPLSVRDRGWADVRDSPSWERGLAVVGTETRRRGKGDSPSPKWRLAARGAAPSVRGVSAGPDRTAVAHGTTVVLERRARVLDDGAVLLGGSPPRMLHLSPAAADRLVERQAHRHRRDVGRARPPPARRRDRAPGRRARRRRAPAVGRDGRGPGEGPHRRPRPPARRARDRREGGSPGPNAAQVDLARVWEGARRAAGAVRARAAGVGARPVAGAGRRAPGPGLRVIVVDDGSADPAAVRAVAERAGAAVLRHPTPRGPPPRATPGSPPPPPRWSRSSTPTSCPSPAGSRRCWRAWRTRPSGWSRRASSRCPRSRAGWAATRPSARRSTSAPTPRWSSRAPASPTSRARRCSSAARPSGAGFDEDMHVAEDVDLVLRLHAAGWRLRYEPAARVAHDHRTSLAAWWLRKAFYGTGAAPLALRHRGAVPPMVLSPWAALDQRAAARSPTGRGGGGVGGRRVPPVPQARPPPPPPLDRGPADRARRGRRRRADRRRRHPALLAAGRAGRARAPDAPAARWRPSRSAAASSTGWRAGPERPALPAFLLARRLDDLAYGAGPVVGCRSHRHSPRCARPARASRARSAATHREGYSERLNPQAAGIRFCGVPDGRRSAIADPFPVRVGPA